MPEPPQHHAHDEANGGPPGEERDSHRPQSRCEINRPLEKSETNLPLWRKKRGVVFSPTIKKVTGPCLYYASESQRLEPLTCVSNLTWRNVEGVEVMNIKRETNACIPQLREDLEAAVQIVVRKAVRVITEAQQGGLSFASVIAGLPGSIPKRSSVGFPGPAL